MYCMRELRSCVKVEVNVPNSLVVPVDVKQHLKQYFTKFTLNCIISPTLLLTFWIARGLCLTHILIEEGENRS